MNSNAVILSWIVGHRLFYWSLAVLPVLPYVLVYLSYRVRLLDKLNTLQNLMLQEGVFTAYRARFGQKLDEQKKEDQQKEDEQKKEVVGKLFDVLYGRHAYYSAICLNLLVITVGVAAGLLRGGISLGLPGALESLAQRVPLTMLLGFAGAYTLNLYNVCRLYRIQDLSPSDLHFTWLHMILASFIAPLLSQAFVASAAYAVAFGIGVFPLKDSFETVRDLAKKRLGVLSTIPVFEGSTLDKLQGLTEDVIERLGEEGITSSVHLAYTDPIRLFLKTNLEWPFLVDIMDQALLFNYLRDSPVGLAGIRALGIRGSIEMVVLGEPVPDGFANPQYEAEEKFDPQRVRQAIAIVASTLGQSPEAIRNLAINLWEDGQVDLIWQLFKAFENPD
jgi:hypothetical protein